MSATIVSLGMIVQTKNEISIAEFQRLADEAGLVDESGAKLNVLTLLPRLQPLFLDYNLGKFSTDGFIEAFHKILPVPKDKIEAAWNAMCIVDDDALETLALIQATNKNKEEGERIYTYSDTNDMHRKNISDQIRARKPEIGEIAVFTTFEHKVSKEKLLQVVVDKTKEEGNKDCSLIIGTNAVENKQLREADQRRDEAIKEAAKGLGVRVESVDSPRLSAKVLKEYLQKSAASKKSPAMTETPLSDRASELREVYSEAYSEQGTLGRGQEALTTSSPTMVTNYEAWKQKSGELNPSSASSSTASSSASQESTASKSSLRITRDVT